MSEPKKSLPSVVNYLLGRVLVSLVMFYALIGAGLLFAWINGQDLVVELQSKEPEKTVLAQTLTPEPSAAPLVKASVLADELAKLTNEQRLTAGLPVLERSKILDRIAQIRAADMAGNAYFGHKDPNGETAFDLMDQLGVAYGWAGENLAMNSYPRDKTAWVAADSLWKSPSHKDNTLQPNYNRFGIGVAFGENDLVYFAIIFVGY